MVKKKRIKFNEMSWFKFDVSGYSVKHVRGTQSLSLVTPAFLVAVVKVLGSFPFAGPTLSRPKGHSFQKRDRKKVLRRRKRKLVSTGKRLRKKNPIQVCITSMVIAQTEVIRNVPFYITTPRLCVISSNLTQKVT